MKTLMMTVAAFTLGYWVMSAPGSKQPSAPQGVAIQKQAPRTPTRYAMPCPPEGCGQPGELSMAWTKFTRGMRDAGRDFSADMRDINRQYQRDVARYGNR